MKVFCWFAFFLIFLARVSLAGKGRHEPLSETPEYHSYSIKFNKAKIASASPKQLTIATTLDDIEITRDFVGLKKLAKFEEVIDRYEEVFDKKKGKMETKAFQETVIKDFFTDEDEHPAALFMSKDWMANFYTDPVVLEQLYHHRLQFNIDGEEKSFVCSMIGPLMMPNSISFTFGFEEAVIEIDKLPESLDDDFDLLDDLDDVVVQLRPMALAPYDQDEPTDIDLLKTRSAHFMEYRQNSDKLKEAQKKTRKLRESKQPLRGEPVDPNDFAKMTADFNYEMQLPPPEQESQKQHLSRRELLSVHHYRTTNDDMYSSITHEDAMQWEEDYTDIDVPDMTNDIMHEHMHRRNLLVDDSVLTRNHSYYGYQISYMEDYCNLYVANNFLINSMPAFNQLRYCICAWIQVYIDNGYMVGMCSGYLYNCVSTMCHEYGLNENCSPLYWGHDYIDTFDHDNVVSYVYGCYPFNILDIFSPASFIDGKQLNTLGMCTALTAVNESQQVGWQDGCSSCQMLSFYSLSWSTACDYYGTGNDRKCNVKSKLHMSYNANYPERYRTCGCSLPNVVELFPECFYPYASFAPSGWQVDFNPQPDWDCVCYRMRSHLDPWGGGCNDCYVFVPLIWNQNDLGYWFRPCLNGLFHNDCMSYGASTGVLIGRENDFECEERPDY